MTAPQHDPDDDAGPARPPLRLALVDPGRRSRLDGGWWPRSRELTVELADLVAHFPASRGHIVRAATSPPDWDDRPGRVAVGHRSVEVDSVPDDDTHVVLALLADGETLQLLVVPPSFSDDQGDEALLAASTAGNRHSATDLLATVVEHPDVDPRHHWR